MSNNAMPSIPHPPAGFCDDVSSRLEKGGKPIPPALLSSSTSVLSGMGCMGGLGEGVGEHTCVLGGMASTEIRDMRE